MDSYNVKRLQKALNLQYSIVGISFIATEEDYNHNSINELSKKVTYCNMVKRASEGAIFKCKKENFGCDYSAYALGIKQPPSYVVSGGSFTASKLYKTAEISKEVTDSMQFPNRSIYGVVLGPLENLDEADIVIMLANGKQTMRIMQGYTYVFGTPKNLLSVGNQAMCSDLTAKPYATKDINVSFLCVGARMYAQCSDDLLGVGMPIDIFNSVAEGVIATLNPTVSAKEKKQLISRLSDSPENELGISIDMDADYGKYIAEYDAKQAQLESRENAVEP